MRKRTGWVASNAARVSEEARVSALIGCRLVDGRYFEIDHAGQEPAWEGRDFHALDYGLELTSTMDRLGRSSNRSSTGPIAEGEAATG